MKKVLKKTLRWVVKVIEYQIESQVAMRVYAKQRYDYSLKH